MRTIMNHSGHTQRGDTIVEVLIAIAVIGGVLAAAYALVSSSGKTNVAAQERSTATKIAETQIELLRSYVAATGAVPTGSNFCLDGSTPAVTKKDITGTLPAPDNNVANYRAECQFDDGAYADKFVAGIKNTGTNKYTVYVTWDAPTGDRAQVSVAYKVYAP